MKKHESGRRNFLITASTFSAATLLFSGAALGAAKAGATKPEADVGPAEDLMREHGGLNRILLIYEEGLRRLQAKSDFDISAVKSSATIIRTFIENYHEKLEEQFIFPRMRKLEPLTGLVDTLETQHKAGRQLTATIETLAVNATVRNEMDRAKLVSALESFVRMYRPHESREDTILFPAFHASMTEKEYDALGEKFEDREHQLFGREGFEGVVVEIEGLEKRLGLYDLAQFTPAPQ